MELALAGEQVGSGGGVGKERGYDDEVWVEVMMVQETALPRTQARIPGRVEGAHAQCV